MSNDRTFRDRMELAVPHEQFVMARLSDADWLAEPFGQGQVSPAMREQLRHYRPDSETDYATDLRWLPDILAAARVNGRSYLRLVDAKSERRHTGNHAVEVSALSAGLVFQAAFRIPVWYVFPDGSCIDVDTLHDTDRKRRRPGVDQGRTDYWLFSADICTPFRDAFRIGPVP